MDHDGTIINDNYGRPIEETNIFDLLASKYDRKALESAMKNAIPCKPEPIDLTFCDEIRRIDFFCHVYKGDLGYFISGWQTNGKILHFPKLLTFRF